VDAGHSKSLADVARMAGLKKRLASNGNPRANDRAKKPFVPNYGT